MLTLRAENVADGQVQQMCGAGACDANTFVNYFRNKWNAMVAQDELMLALSFFDPRGTGYVQIDQLKQCLAYYGDQPLSQNEINDLAALAGNGGQISCQQLAQKLLVLGS